MNVFAVNMILKLRMFVCVFNFLFKCFWGFSGEDDMEELTFILEATFPISYNERRTVTVASSNTVKLNTVCSFWIPCFGNI